MGLLGFWKNYKVLIVTGSGLGLIHLGWYQLKNNPHLHRTREDWVPEPGIVAHVSAPVSAPAAKSK